MHAAEISVARELARLAAAPQLNISANKVDLWINKNEEQTSMPFMLVCVALAREISCMAVR